MIECPLGCGTKMKANRYEEHAHSFCEMRVFPCGLGCGEMVMHKDSAEHKRTTCKCRIVQCELCGKDLQENEREHHQTWKCRKRVMLCGFGCGKQFIADRKNH